MPAIIDRLADAYETSTLPVADDGEIRVLITAGVLVEYVAVYAVLAGDDAVEVIYLELTDHSQDQPRHRPRRRRSPARRVTRAARACSTSPSRSNSRSCSRCSLSSCAGRSARLGGLPDSPWERCSVTACSRGRGRVGLAVRRVAGDPPDPRVVAPPGRASWTRRAVHDSSMSGVESGVKSGAIPGVRLAILRAWIPDPRWRCAWRARSRHLS
jgi:hypothetical protein